MRLIQIKNSERYLIEDDDQWCRNFISYYEIIENKLEFLLAGEELEK